jgi:hypothetical protein
VMARLNPWISRMRALRALRATVSRCPASERNTRPLYIDACVRVCVCVCGERVAFGMMQGLS